MRRDLAGLLDCHRVLQPDLLMGMAAIALLVCRGVEAGRFEALELVDGVVQMLRVEQAEVAQAPNRGTR